MTRSNFLRKLFSCAFCNFFFYCLRHQLQQSFLSFILGQSTKLKSTDIFPNVGADANTAVLTPCG